MQTAVLERLLEAVRAGATLTLQGPSLLPGCRPNARAKLESDSGARCTEVESAELGAAMMALAVQWWPQPQVGVTPAELRRVGLEVASVVAAWECPECPSCGSKAQHSMDRTGNVLPDGYWCCAACGVVWRRKQ